MSTLKGTFCKPKSRLFARYLCPTDLPTVKNFDRQNEIRRQNDIETYTSMTYFCMKTESTRLRMTRITRRQNDIETYTSMTYFCTKTESTRLRMTRIARRQNDIETYASMTYFCTKTKATRLRIARMTRIIIANIIREIRVIRSSNHKVQCSKLNVQR